MDEFALWKLRSKEKNVFEKKNSCELDCVQGELNQW